MDSCGINVHEIYPLHIVSVRMLENEARSKKILLASMTWFLFIVVCLLESSPIHRYQALTINTLGT